MNQRVSHGQFHFKKEEKNVKQIAGGPRPANASYGKTKYLSWGARLKMLTANHIPYIQM